MSEFINTVDLIGEEELQDRLIQRTLTELYDDRLSQLGTGALNGAAIQLVVLPNVKTVGNSALSSTGNTLVRADFSSVTSIADAAFRWTNKLTALIIRTDGICTLEAVRAFESSGISNGTGYVYVPRSLVEEYKAATNWSTYAAQFRALEDYTVDGTITGELDETKIAA